MNHEIVVSNVIKQNVYHSTTLLKHQSTQIGPADKWYTDNLKFRFTYVTTIRSCCKPDKILKLSRVYSGVMQSKNISELIRLELNKGCI